MSDIIKLPFQSIAGKLLAMRRTPKTTEQYGLIGGSPIRTWTNAQGALLAQKLDEMSPETAPHRHYIAFRYVEPETEASVDKILKDGAEDVIAFTQYPQYSCTTSGSSFNELWRVLQRKPQFPPLSIIDRWGSNMKLAEAFAKLIRKELAHFSDPSKAVLLFSAHSIPHRVVDSGDTYPMEVAETVANVMKVLGHSNPYRLVWQSQVGPLPWLGPKTEDALKGLQEHGQKEAVLIPIAFTSDHIETLYELDLLYMKEANKHGMNVRRCEALNTEPLFIDALADVVLTHLKQGRKSSQQFSMRCTGCTSDDCLQQKAYFCK